MAMNLRCDNYFWKMKRGMRQLTGMRVFWNRIKIKRLFFWNLELDLIRRLLYVSLLKDGEENSSYSLIRLNMDEAVVPESFGERAIGIGGDMAKAITDIRRLVL